MLDKEINSITELSRQSNVSKPKIHEFLRGESPLATTFLRLALFLDISPDDLIICTDENKEIKNNEK